MVENALKLTKMVDSNALAQQNLQANSASDNRLVPKDGPARFLVNAVLATVQKNLVLQTVAMTMLINVNAKKIIIDQLSTPGSVFPAIVTASGQIHQIAQNQRVHVSVVLVFLAGPATNVQISLPK